MNRFLKKVFLWFLLLIIVFNAGIILFGKTYFYTALAKTYFSGQSGPGIYDLNKFEFRPISKGHSEPWPFHPSYNTAKLSKEDGSYLESINTSSFLIVREGQLFFEQYWDQHDTATVSNSFSVAKSIVAMLAEAARKDGYITSFEDRVGKYVEEFNQPAFSNLRLSHLMSMSSGLRWSESGINPFSDNAEAYYGTDIAKLVKDRMKPEEEPGRYFDYKSGNTELLGMAIERAVGMPLATYASKKLWRPLQTEHDSYWSLDKRNGLEKAYCCWYAITRDFARIGQLMLQMGNWQGTQVLDSSFIEDARTPATVDLREGGANLKYSKRSWWLLQYRGIHYYYARGILGQYIIVMPEQRAVVVRTGKKRGDVDDRGHPRDIYRYIDMANNLLK